ncbi:MAG: hypothetical protein M5U08_25680, partial [Burkholderiales bacterium]|nr:hypothetical protein [Burkholderiales bacterium]
APFWFDDDLMPFLALLPSERLPQNVSMKSMSDQQRTSICPERYQFDRTRISVFHPAAKTQFETFSARAEARKEVRSSPGCPPETSLPRRAPHGALLHRSLSRHFKHNIQTGIAFPSLRLSWESVRPNLAKSDGLHSFEQPPAGAAGGR